MNLNPWASRKRPRFLMTISKPVDDDLLEVDDAQPSRPRHSGGSQCLGHYGSSNLQLAPPTARMWNFGAALVRILVLNWYGPPFPLRYQKPLRM